jgi:hypothetical protein
VYAARVYDLVPAGHAQDQVMVAPARRLAAGGRCVETRVEFGDRAAWDAFWR